jgi:sugar phosphate isomerase/epimerase
MRYSIASFSFHGALADGSVNIFTYLEACRFRYHLDTADIWSGLLGADLEKTLSEPFLKQVRRAMDDRGLECVNYHADGCHPWEDDASARQRHLALAERHIHAGELLGARTIRIDTGGRDRTWTDEQFDYIVPVYQRWAGRAHAAGYTIGPETHWGATNHPDNMLKLARAVNSPGYGILLHMGKDTAASPDEYDRLLAPIAVHTHIDQKTTYARVDSALKILVDAGYRGVLGIEHHTGKNELAEVEAQLALVRRSVALQGTPAPTYKGNPLLHPRDEGRA